MSMTWSGAVQTFQIKFADGTALEVTTNFADAMRWEANNKGKAVHEDRSMTQMLTRAWYAARREGLNDDRTFAAFAEKVVDLGIVENDDEGDTDDEVDPTQTDQLGG